MMITRFPRATRWICPQPRISRSLSLECLESRETPATFVVTTLLDSLVPIVGQLTLRQAIQLANAQPGPDRIEFAPGLSGVLQAVDVFTITDSVEIAGPGANIIAINGLPAGTLDPQRALFENNSPETIFSGLTIQNHEADFSPGYGGAIYNYGGLVIDRMIFRGNQASYGGAIANLPGTTLVVRNSEFYNNNAYDSGGAIFHDGDSLIITDSLFQENSALNNFTGFSGGAIFIQAGINQIERSAFVGNSAVVGGGIAISNLVPDTEIILRNLTFAENFASQHGSAVDFTDIDGESITIRITNITAARNTGGGEAIRFPAASAGFGPSIQVRNSLIAENIVNFDSDFNQFIPPVVPAPDIAGAFVSLGGNLIQNPSLADFIPATNDLTGVPALLGPLANHGGPTPTISLLATSPALGRALSGGATPAIDQRGVIRPVTGPIDTGAFQFRLPVAVPESYTVPSLQTLTVSPAGILSNDFSSDGGVILAELVSSVPLSTGTLTLNSDGSFVFTPAPGFLGTTAFLYRARVADRTSDPVSVTIIVTPAFSTFFAAEISTLEMAAEWITVTPAFSTVFAVGAGAGNLPRVQTYDFSGKLQSDFLAFESSFSGGVRVAVGDVNHDGTADIIAGAGPAGGPRLRVFDGTNGHAIRDFYAFEESFAGGIYVASGDVNGDGASDIVVGAGSLGGPRVRVFDGRTGAVLHDFFAYDPGFRGGVRVAVGDVNGDGFADIVTAAGPSGGPHIRGFDGRSGEILLNFFAYDETYVGGVYVSVIPASSNGPAQILFGLDSFPDFTGSVFEALSNNLLNDVGNRLGKPFLTSQLLAPALIGTVPIILESPTGVGPVSSPIDVYPGFSGGVRVGGGLTPNGPVVYTGMGIGGGPRLRLFLSSPEGLIPFSDISIFEPGYVGSVYVG